MGLTARRALLLAFLLPAFSNRPLGDLAGITLRPDWIGGALAVGVVAIAALRGHLPRHPVLLPMSCFVGIQVISALANSGAWPEGTKFSLIYVLALGYLCAMLVLIRDLDTARWVIGALIAIAVAEAVIAILTVLSWNALGLPRLPPGTPTRTLYLRSRGLMSEANLFSSLLLVPLTVALWRWGASRRWSWPLGLGTAALVAGLVFGLTRAAWAAAIAVGILWVLRCRPAPAKARFIGAAAAAAVLVFFASDLVARQGVVQHTALYDKLAGGIVRGVDSPMKTRLEEARTGTDGLREGWWLGHGTGSVNTLKQYVGKDPKLRKNPWIGNAFLFLLYDAGLVGLLAFVWTLVVLAFEWRRAAGRIPDPEAALDHESLFVGAAATLLAWQTTHGLWQMYGYVYLGVLLALNGLAPRWPRWQASS